MGPAATFHRWQDPAWRHLEAGDGYLRRLLVVSATAVIRHKGQIDADGELDQNAHGEEAVQARLRCAGQQARPDRMGRANTKKSLSVPPTGSPNTDPGNPNW